jgi:DNA invertase Pin-like site-specific DNA recombinase
MADMDKHIALVATYLREGDGAPPLAEQREALQALVTQRGWRIVRRFEEADQRPASRTRRRAVKRLARVELGELIAAAPARRFDAVVTYSLTQLGQSLPQLLDVLGKLDAAGVHLVCCNPQLDTSAPDTSGFFVASAALAQAAGIFKASRRERAVRGAKRAQFAGNPLGRPRIAAETEQEIRRRLRAGEGINKIARTLRTGSGTVQCIKREIAHIPARQDWAVCADVQHRAKMSRKTAIVLGREKAAQKRLAIARTDEFRAQHAAAAAKRAEDLEPAEPTSEAAAVLYAALRSKTSSSPPTPAAGEHPSATPTVASPTRSNGAA